MKQGWEIKKLGEVSEILNGGTPKTNIAEYWDGEIHWITPADLGKLKKPTVDDTPRKITRLGLEKSSAKLFPINSVILSTRAPIGHLAINNVPMSTNQGCRGIVPSKKLDTWYLYYFLKKNVELLDSLGTGATFKELSTKALAGVEIPLPPLPEQQRIVSILDEAFAAIAKAKANAEQNLKNAKELFESYLQGVFEKKGDGWEECNLEDNIKLIDYRGRTPQKTESGVRLITAKNVKLGFLQLEPQEFIAEDNYESWMTRGIPNVGDVIFTTEAPLANVAQIESDEKLAFAQRIIVMQPNRKKLNPTFLKYMLLSIPIRNKILGKGTGATVVGIKSSLLKKIPIPFPKSIDEQQTIVRQLDALRAETQKLEAVYQQKIADLEELKKSILQKAFAGELSNTASINLIQFKTISLEKVENISPTDLQAGITAIALKKHIEKNKHSEFGHVKAEKIVHLAEYILNIDLERNPVKDVAGPNDFPHAKKVESRAAKAGFYIVAKKAMDQETGYIFTQGKAIDTLISKSQDRLGNRNEVLSELLNLIVPLKTQQAEIVATVFAAWNNLLLNNCNFSDEDIVLEARENWREEKLKIPRDKFFKAIEWMKSNEILIPKGNGKRVILPKKANEY